MEGRLEATQSGPDDRIRIEPLTKPVGAGLLKVVSMGFLSPEDEAIMWRGLMLLRGVQHFLEEVAWGDLDYLLVDMPPGTGDIQMGLARMLPRAEMLIVTTPALAAQKVAVRAADMARKGYLRVAGVDREHERLHLRRTASTTTCSGRAAASAWPSEIGAPLLARIPLRAGRVRRGRPGRAGGPRRRSAGRVFAALVDAVLEIAPVVEMGDCTARMLDAIEAAVASSPS